MASNGNNAQIFDTTPRAESNRSHAAGAGRLIIIGGHEDKTGEKEILAHVAEIAKGGRILVPTLASSFADEVWKEYENVFRELGVRDVEHLDIPNRNCAFDAAHVE